MSTILRTDWLGFLGWQHCERWKKNKDNLTKNGDDADKKPLTRVK